MFFCLFLCLFRVSLCLPFLSYYNCMRSYGFSLFGNLFAFFFMSYRVFHIMINSIIFWCLLSKVFIFFQCSSYFFSVIFSVVFEQIALCT